MPTSRRRLPLLALAGLLPPATLRAQSGRRAGNWAGWRQRQAAVFEGNYTASDPSVRRDGDALVMAYTDLDPFKNRTAIHIARSADGLAWHGISEVQHRRGRVLEGVDGAWDENLEGPELVQAQNRWFLYYSGYRDHGTPQRGFPAALGLAISADGRTYSRPSSTPIMSPTPGWYDNDAIHSPTILVEGGQFLMIYVGHAYTRHDHIPEPGVTLLGATSPDGFTWTKRPQPVLVRDGAMRHARSGVAEPCLVRGPDGKYYLFFTGLDGDARRIMVARGDSPWGPWQVNPLPVVNPAGPQFQGDLVLAPAVLIEDGKVRLWFIGQDAKQRIRIGYSEADWPLFQAP